MKNYVYMTDKDNVVTMIRQLNAGEMIHVNGTEIKDKMVAVANGELTKAEVLGHKEFGIYRIGDTF